MTDLDLVPTQRPYADVYQYCPWLTDGSCGVCIKRCPVGAIDDSGKDHRICMTNGDQNIRQAYAAWGYHSCGHCQVNLPCTDRIPSRRSPERRAAAPAKQRGRRQDG